MVQVDYKEAFQVSPLPATRVALNPMVHYLFCRTGGKEREYRLAPCNGTAGWLTRNIP